ncbi:hypothetical protein Tco_0179876 [Tanacetum coccineum]
MHTTHDTEEPATMPHDSPLQRVQSLGRDEGSMTLFELTILCTNLSNKVTSLEAELAQTKQTYGTALTKLIKKVKKLEKTVKSTQARRRIMIVVSDDEEGLEDPSKQGRKITEIDQDPSILLVQDEGTSWIQEDIEIQEKISDDTKVVLEEEEPTELVEDQGSGEKEVSTVGAEHSTVILEVSTAAANLVYIRRSAQKRKDKGKAIMKEDEFIDEEERQRIARDAEIAKQLQEEINKETQEQEKQEVVTEADPTHVIDWSDPAVIRYHALQNRAFSIPEVRKNVCMYLINQGGYKMRHFKGMSYEDIRPIFENVWDQIHSFVPMDSELEILKLKRAKPIKRQSTEEEKKRDDSSKPAKGRRKKTLARKRASGKDSEESMKKQKLEDDNEKKDLKAYLGIIPGNDVAIDIESLATKADESSKNYKIFSEMLDDFDRQDGDLKTLFELDEEDEVWRNQQGYNLISWRLYDLCGIHILLMDNGIAIHIMIEKKYPLNQEMLSRMEVDHESTMAYELLRFIRSQRIKPTLYDGIVISAKHVAMPMIDNEETLILEEESRSKMSEKEKDPEAIKQNISHKPIAYEKLNRLSDDFGKCFTPQQELSAEQAFWLCMSNPTSKPSDTYPVKIEAPKEIPKVSLVNESLKNLKFHLARFDNAVKIRTTPDACTEGERGFEHTKAVFNKEIIPFLKSLKDIFNVFDRDLLNEIMEVQIVFDQMDAAVQQSSVDKQCLEIAKK